MTEWGRTHGCRQDPGRDDSDPQRPRPQSSVDTDWTWICSHIHPAGALWGWISPPPVNMCRAEHTVFTLNHSGGGSTDRQMFLCSGLKQRQTLCKTLPVYTHHSVAASDSVSSSEDPVHPLWTIHPFYHRIYTNCNTEGKYHQISSYHSPYLKFN